MKVFLDCKYGLATFIRLQYELGLVCQWTNLESLTLIPVSNRIEILTSKVHAIPGLLCWDD